MGRRSIWSKPEIIELTKSFVTATDEVWRLQNGQDSDCRLFQSFADQGHYRNHKSTRQGIYVVTARGKLLGSLNTHNTEAVAKMLQEALTQYPNLPEAERKLAAESDITAKHRWELSYQADGLDLTMFARDLPNDGPTSKSRAAWNEDRIWFSLDEVKKMFPQDQLEVGQSWPLPEKLANRFARFNIVDTVKGQTTPYSPEHIQNATIEFKLLQQDQQQIKVQITGSTKAEADKSRGQDMPHGIETQLLGMATYDRTAQRFTEFEMVAAGQRWGRTVFNGRHRHLKASPVGFAFRLTPADAPLIAPAFLYSYNTDWIVFQR